MRFLNHPAFAEKSILVVDRQPKTTNDRTWCFWEKEPGLFDDIVFHRWQQARFYAGSLNLPLSLAPYTYKMIRSISLYTAVLNRAAQHANIHFLYGNVTAVTSQANSASVTINGQAITADFVFNSIVFENLQPTGKRHYLLQHFKGYVVETSENVFNAAEATLMDFRVSQKHGTTFVYVLPFSANRALVEYTLFTGKLLQPAEYDAALHQYMHQYVATSNYQVIETEFGVIPMTNHSFTRTNNRVINLGTAGGDTKGSSGYTFQFIQKTCDQIIASLLGNGVPQVQVPFLQKRFSFYDSTLLNILANNKMPGEEIFATLFKNNPTERVLRFLDNESSLIDDVKLMATLPQWLFMKAAVDELTG